MSVSKTLKARGKRYGQFKDHAEISQGLKSVMHNTTNWNSLSAAQKESLEMIQHKVARILNGDPNYADNWHDISGYSQLAEELCEQ